ncbi:MAG: type II toxin-antitoxin system Phd/YefM family antitoxin [Chloroflexales bacterium]
MPKSTTALALDVDLRGGVVPISKVASSLAALIKRGKERQQPIIVTQKGYPTGVLLPIDLYSALRDLAQREVGDAYRTADAPADTLTDEAAGDAPALAVDAAPDEVGSVLATADAPIPRRGRGGRQAKAAQ